MVKPFMPNRGDVVWLDFSPHAGREQAGRRPALVLSPKAYNQKTGRALVCPITSQVKGYPFEVAIPEGLAVGGVVLADHVKNQDLNARNAAYACTVSDDVLFDVVELIQQIME
jgi:mRNA interferase MazF